MWKTEPSYWGATDFASRLTNSLVNINFNLGGVDIRNCWDTNFSKKEFWKRTEATKRQLLKEFDSNQEKCRLLYEWIYKNTFEVSFV